MNRMDKSETDARTRRVWILLVAVALVGWTLALTLTAAPVAGNTPTPTPTPTPSLDEKAPYYNTTTPQVDNQSWTHGHRNPTLANVSHYLTRVGGFVIGDQPAQGGGYAGPLILGFVVMGAFLGSTLGSGVGPVGGGVLVATGVSGLTIANIAPAWVYPVIVFVIGGVVTAVVLRSFK